MAKLQFPTAFTYPFHRWVGLFNILWALVPIYGWFLLVGYKVRIVDEFLAGKVKELPRIAHGDDFILGLQMFIKLIPGILVLIAAAMVVGMLGAGNEVTSGLLMLAFVAAALLIIPTMWLNFVRKKTIASYFEFDLLSMVFRNFGDYVLALLKEIALGLVFFVLMFVLVGIPANAFTKNIFLADFFRRHMK